MKRTRLFFSFALIACLFSRTGIAQWVEKNNGVNGSFIYALAASGTNLFAATRGGIYRSQNNGASWTATNGYPTATVLAVIGTNLFAASMNGNGVSLSTNSGVTWTDINTGFPNNIGVPCLLAKGNSLFAGTSGKGVYVTSNNGATWTTANAGISDTMISALGVSGDNLFAATDKGIFLSTNNGGAWTAVSKIQDASVTSFAAIGTNLFAATNLGVYLTENNGTSWRPMNDGLLDTYVLSLAVSGSTLFLGTRIGVFMSTNSGSLWTPANSGIQYSFVSSILVNGGSLFAGTFGGIFLSSNTGTSWTPANSGLNHVDIRSISGNGSTLFAGSYFGGIVLSTNNGVSWTAANAGIASHLVVSSAIVGNTLYAGTYAGLYQSTNNGTNWTRLNLPVPDRAIMSMLISGVNFFAGTDLGLYLSTDNGVHWTSVNTGIGPGEYVATLAVIGNTFFAGTQFGGVYVSTDNGKNWKSSSTGLTDTATRSFAVIGTRLFVSTSGGVFVSTNNGASWTAVNTGITDLYVYSLIAVRNNLFAGTIQGLVFLSTNFGVSWTPVNSGLVAFTVNSLATSGPNIYAGTGNRGVWSRPTSDFSIVPKADQAITFNSLPVKTYGDAPFNLDATVGSPLALAYTSNNTSVATISGNVVTVVGAGTSVITAIQSGDSDYNQAALTQTLTVSKLNQTINLPAIAAKTLGDAPFNPSATASSSLAVVYSSTSDKVTIAGSQITLVKPGSVTITADQAGNANFNAATSATQTFCVNPGKPLVTATGLNTLTPLLTSNATSGNQWYKNGTVISSATSATYTVTESGSYNVKVIVDNCTSELSAELPVVITGDIHTSSDSDLTVYPNPAKNEIIVGLQNLEKGVVVEVVVYDLSGKQFDSKVSEGGTRLTLDIRHYGNGSYVVRALQNRKTYSKQFVKE